MGPSTSRSFENSRPPNFEAQEACTRVAGLLIPLSPSHCGPSSHFLYYVVSLFTVRSGLHVRVRSNHGELLNYDDEMKLRYLYVPREEISSMLHRKKEQKDMEHSGKALEFLS